MTVDDNREATSQHNHHHHTHAYTPRRGRGGDEKEAGETGETGEGRTGEQVEEEHSEGPPVDRVVHAAPHARLRGAVQVVAAAPATPKEGRERGEGEREANSR